MLSATDWAVKRLFKIVLKRNLGRVFKGDVDLDQLEVQLGKGTLELRSVLLNCSHLNQHLASTNWELVTGYVGRVSAVIPFASLQTDPCTAELDEILLKFKYKDVKADRSESVQSELGKTSSDASLQSEYDDKYLAHTAITDGVRLIAGGIDNLLHQLQLKASRITAYLEFPSTAEGAPGAIVLLTLNNFQFSSQDVFQTTRLGDQQLLQTQLNKSVSFDGLRIEVCTSSGSDLPTSLSTKDYGRTPFAPSLSLIDETEESLELRNAQRTTILCNNEGLGCAGRFSIQLKSVDNLKPHHVIVDVNLDPFQLQLHSDQLSILATLADSLGSIKKAPQPAESSLKPDEALSDTVQPFALSSFFQGFSLPDVEGFVSDALKMGSPGSPTQLLPSEKNGTQSAIEEFFDCSSVLGSVRNGISSVLSRPGSTQVLETADSPAKTETEIKVQTAELSVVLWYPQCAISLPHADSTPETYVPGRLALECSDILMNVKLSESQTMVNMSLYRLEAAEYLGSSSADAASTNSAIAEFANAPDRLPPTPTGARPTLSFCGVAMQPATMPSMYNSTLSHLSCMSCSWTEAASREPCVQVWPVLAMSGMRPHATLPPVPSVDIAVSITKSTAGNGPSAAKLDVNLRPSTLWLSAPLLDRITVYCKPLLDRISSDEQDSPRDVIPCAPAVLRHTNSKAAVEMAIHSILDDLQEFQEDRGGGRTDGRDTQVATSWDVGIRAAQVCVVLAVPPPPAGAAPHLYSNTAYLAMDVYPPRYRVGGTTEQSRVVTFQYPGGSCPEAAPGVSCSPPCTWESHLSLGRMQLFVLSVSGAHTNMADSMDNVRPVQVNCVVDMSCATSVAVGDGLGQVAPGVALHAEIQCRRGVPPASHLADHVWSHAATHAGKNTAHLDGSGVWSNQPGETVSVQDQCLSSSSTVVLVRLPNFYAEVSQPDFVVLWHVLDTYLKLSQRRLETYEAIRSGELEGEQQQTTVMFNCGGKVTLIGNNQVSSTGSVMDPQCYSLQLNSVECTSVSCLGGSPEGAALLVTAKGLSLKGEQADTSTTLLCLPDNDNNAAVDLVQVTRPRAMLQSFMVNDPSKFSVFTESLVSLKCVGANVATTQEHINLPWIPALAQFFDTGVPAAGEKLPSPLTEVVVHLQDAAFLLDTRSVHSALLVGELVWQQAAGSTASSSLALQCLAVFAAPLAPSTRPADVHSTASRVKLLQSGYSCLAEDGEVSMQLAQPEEEGGASEIIVSNQRLCSVITQSSLGLLKELAADISSAFSAPAKAAPEAPSTQSSGSSCSTDVMEPGVQEMVQLWQHLQEDHFRRDDADPDVDASVFLSAGWYDDTGMEEVGSASLTSASSSPLLIEDFLAVAPVGTWFAEEDLHPEGVAVWYSEATQQPSPPSLQEDYVKVPASESAGVSCQRCPIGSLPAGYPRPVTRFIARDIRCRLKLLKEERAGGASDVCEYVEVDMDRVCCQYDTFGPTSQCAMRLAVAVHNLEVHDWRTSEGTGGKKSGSRMRTLGHHSLNKMPSSGSSTLFNMMLEAVRPDPDAHPANQELRLHVGLMPLKLDLDQNVVLFLQDFFASLPAGSPASDAPPPAPDGPHIAPDGPPTAAHDSTFFQRCEIEAFNVVLDYRPRKFDMTALRAGNLAEVMNIFPWAGVDLQLKRLKLFGVQGWSSLATAVATTWLEDIAKYQIHKLIAGIKPVRSLSRVSQALLQLISIPAEQLFRDSFPAASHQSVSWQLRRGVMKLLRAVMTEGIGMGQNIAAGAQLVLNGRLGSLDSRGSSDSLPSSSFLSPTTSRGASSARIVSNVSSSPLVSHPLRSPDNTVARQISSSSSSSVSPEDHVVYPTLFSAAPAVADNGIGSNPWDGGL